MKLLFSFLAGAVVSVAATFIHSFLPPFGIVIAILGTYAGIWSIGRIFGKRIYKLVATTAWLIIFWQAATFGVGKEILILGNTLGNYFLVVSAIALFIAVLLPAN